MWMQFINILIALWYFKCLYKVGDIKTKKQFDFFSIILFPLIFHETSTTWIGEVWIINSGINLLKIVTE